jgi:dipicolinate synthase subunit B
LDGKRIGFGLTGSHCTIAEVLREMQRMTQEGAEVLPVLSASVATESTRYGSPDDWRKQLFEITGRMPLETITDVEPLAPKHLLDAMVIAPCTGNSLAKMANGIIDGAVLMAAKGLLRNGRPVVVAVSTNDGLGANASNIGTLLNAKNIYLVPFGQDAPVEKRNSLVAKMELITETLCDALEGRQIEPVLVGR